MILHDQRHLPSRSRLEAHLEARPVGGVCKHVSQQSVYHCLQVAGGACYPVTTRSDLQRPTPALLVGERPPILGATAHHAPQIDGGTGALSHRSPRLPDDVIHRTFQFVDVVGEPLPLLDATERLGIEAQRGERSPQSVRQVGHHLSLLSQQHPDPLDEAVESSPHFDQLRRP